MIPTGPDYPFAEIRIPFEGRPEVRLFAPNYEAEVRYLEWISARPRLLAIWNEAVELHNAGLPVASGMAA